MLNSVILIGRNVKEMDLKYLQNGTALTRFTLAVDKNLSKDKKAELESKGENTADFINITAWGKQAEFVASYLGKGKKVAVQGRIQTGSYEKDGQRIYTTDVVANNIEILESKNDNESNNDIPEGFHPTDNAGIPF